MRLTITQIIDGNENISVRYTLRDELRFGRDPRSCDLVVHDPSVSREHASLRATHSGLVLEDMRSRLGTRLNGQPLTSVSPVHSGDILEIGNHVFLVNVQGGPKATHPEQTHNLDCAPCPHCGAQVLQDFTNCLICGKPL